MPIGGADLEPERDPWGGHLTRSCLPSSDTGGTKYAAVSSSRLRRPAVGAARGDPVKEGGGDGGAAVREGGSTGVAEEGGGEREEPGKSASIPMRLMERRGGVSEPRRANPQMVGAFAEKERPAEEGGRPGEEREVEPAPKGAEPRAGAHEACAADATTGLLPPAEAPVVP